MPTQPAPATPPQSTDGSPFAAIRALFRNSRVQYLPLPGWVARFLSLYGMVGMLGYYTLKQFFAPERPWLVTIGGPLLITAGIALTLVIGSTYSFIAFASRKDIDERELLQRNAAYFRTHQYMVVAALVGCLIMEFCERATGLSISTAQMGNFLTVLFFCGLILPASILAWQDRGVQDSDDDFEQRTA